MCVCVSVLFDLSVLYNQPQGGDKARVNSMYYSALNATVDNRWSTSQRWDLNQSSSDCLQYLSHQKNGKNAKILLK